MKTLICLLLSLIFLTEGCFLLSGKLYRSELKVVLVNDKPSYYRMTGDQSPGDRIGTLDKLAGDTITTIGKYGGGAWTNSYYLIMVGAQQVYLLRSEVLTPDDQIYRRLGDKFKLPLIEDEDAWSRALDYVKDQPSSVIEVSNESLIKTKSSSDTSSISYLLTRVEQDTLVEYEIICKSLRKDFDPSREANQLAFYMVTGRTYSWEN
jgi:hypothetical protein